MLVVLSNKLSTTLSNTNAQILLMKKPKMPKMPKMAKMPKMLKMAKMPKKTMPQEQSE